MLARLDLRGSTAPLHEVLPRSGLGEGNPKEAVQNILTQVKANGDEALRELTERFDGCRPPSLTIGRSEMEAALARVPEDFRQALETAAENIRLHHQGQQEKRHTVSRQGLTIESWSQPVERAGCYVPGGRAAYPSTVLMTAIIARVAGVKKCVVCVPPGPDGLVPDATLAAAAVAQVDVVHPVGGAQAIAALAYGTESVEPVEVIVGPGNVYVALAKREVAGLVAVPSAFAGPSEVVVIADESAPPELVAIDLMVQAEHGPQGLAWLITWDQTTADRVDAALQELLAAAPRRKEIESTLQDAGYCVLVDDPAQALAVSDAIAPEHLEIMTVEAAELAGQVRHAGAIFCGPWSPASLGDYVAGPSHVLPTAGTARFSGALTVSDFTKEMHIVTASPEAIEKLGPTVVVLAEAEGLDAHAASLRMRQDLLAGQNDD